MLNRTLTLYPLRNMQIADYQQFRSLYIYIYIYLIISTLREILVFARSLKGSG